MRRTPLIFSFSKDFIIVFIEDDFNIDSVGDQGDIDTFVSVSLCLFNLKLFHILRSFWYSSVLTTEMFNLP